MPRGEPGGRCVPTKGAFEGRRCFLEVTAAQPQPAGTASGARQVVQATARPADCCLASSRLIASKPATTILRSVSPWLSMMSLDAERVPLRSGSDSEPVIDGHRRGPFRRLLLIAAMVLG